MPATRETTQNKIKENKTKIYGKWIEEEQPEFMDELAKSLGQSY